MQRLEKKYPNFTQLEFVLKARAKDKIKPVFNFLYVEELEDGKKMFICSDLRRLHAFTSDNEVFNGEFETGFYEVIKANKSEIILNKKEFDGTFPDWKQIFPKETKVFAEFDKSETTRTAYFYHGFYITFGTNYNMCINPEILKDAFIDGQFVKISIQEDYFLSPIVFRYDYLNCFALVMPIQAR
jgi:hypothetical protein